MGVRVGSSGECGEPALVQGESPAAVIRSVASTLKGRLGDDWHLAASRAELTRRGSDDVVHRIRLAGSKWNRTDESLEVMV